MNLGRAKTFIPFHRVWIFLITVVCLSLYCLPIPASTTNYVSIKDSAFIPEQLVVFPGDTVIWTQDDITEHSVTSKERLFDSHTMLPESEFSFTFTDMGNYEYYCTFHGAGAMAGVIEVSEPIANAPPSAPTNTFPPHGATNQPLAIQLSASPFVDSDTNDFHEASHWVLSYTNDVVAEDSGIQRGTNLTTYTPVGLIEETKYDWKVRHRDARGTWSEFSKPTRFSTFLSFTTPGVGLRGSFHNSSDFTRPLIVETNSTIDFDWEKARPHRRITSDEFGVRWEGFLLPKYSELYQIEFECRGRARVWINNELLIDDWTPNPFILARRKNIPLSAGQLAPIRIEYVAASQGGLAVLRWMSPNVPMEVIPATRLYPEKP